MHTHQFYIGYKQRRQIATALQTRSAAIKKALTDCNNAAVELGIDEQLSWDDIVDKTFLSEFDIFCRGRDAVAGLDWAQPANRAARTLWLKSERAKEEIARCCVEIRRMATKVVDEEQELAQAVADCVDPLVAFEIDRRRARQTRVNDVHRQYFKRIANLNINVDLTPGTRLQSTNRRTQDADTPDDIQQLIMLPTRDMLELAQHQDGVVPDQVDDSDDEEYQREADGIVNFFVTPENDN